MTSEITAIVTCIAAVAGVIVAYWQLSNLNATLQMNVLAIVLQLESEMNARKQRVDECATKIRTEASKGDEANRPLIEILEDELRCCVENWLNSADRLAYCIKKRYLQERDWKTEYRDYFNELVKTHSEYFGPASIYTNIIDVNSKWRRE